MQHTDDVKWALLDLIRALDHIFGGRYHTEFRRIALTLDVDLPDLPQVHDAHGGNGKLAAEDQ